LDPWKIEGLSIICSILEILFYLFGGCSQKWCCCCCCCGGYPSYPSELDRSGDLIAVLLVPQEGQESDQLQNPRPDPNSPDPNRAEKSTKNDEKSPGVASKQHDLLKTSKLIYTNLGVGANIL